MIKEVQSAIDSYEQGDCAKGSTYTDLLYMIPAHGVQAVMDSLPESWRREFEAWLVSNYDNEIPVEEFLVFGLSQEEENMKDVPIPLVRAWLRSDSRRK
jgi:hypothetical protein